MSAYNQFLKQLNDRIATLEIRLQAEKENLINMTSKDYIEPAFGLAKYGERIIVLQSQCEELINQREALIFYFKNENE